MVTLPLKMACQAWDGDAARVCLGSRLDEVGFYAAVDRDARFGGMRDDRVGLLGKQTVLRQLVQKGRRI